MASDLYPQSLKDLAAAGIGAGRLETADHRATLDNPLCGDRISVEVTLESGRITALGHTVQGCLLCRAAASAMAEQASGLDIKGVGALADAMTAMLKTGGSPPFPQAEAFLPVSGHKSRHNCVLLPFKALMEVVKNQAP